jgi:hypothetical protein
MTLLIMSKVMLLGLLGVDSVLLSGIHVLLAEQTLHLCSNFMVDNCLIIFSNNIDTEFL